MQIAYTTTQHQSYTQYTDRRFVHIVCVVRVLALLFSHLYLIDKQGSEDEDSALALTHTTEGLGTLDSVVEDFKV